MVKGRSLTAGLRGPGRRPPSFESSLLGVLDNHVRTVLIRRMIKQASNVVDEKWIQQIRDFLLVGEVKSAVKRNPDAF